MGGCVVELEPSKDPARFLRREGLVEVLRAVRTQVVEHDADALGLRVVAVDEVTHAVGEVDVGPLVGHLDVAPPSMRIDEDEEIRRPVPSIFVVDPFGPAGSLCLEQRFEVEWGWVFELDDLVIAPRRGGRELQCIVRHRELGLDNHGGDIERAEAFQTRHMVREPQDAFAQHAADSWSERIDPLLHRRGVDAHAAGALDKRRELACIDRDRCVRIHAPPLRHVPAPERLERRAIAKRRPGLERAAKLGDPSAVGAKREVVPFHEQLSVVCVEPHGLTISEIYAAGAPAPHDTRHSAS